LKEGIVYLVGAGPGDRGLITAKGLECLRRAEAVIYDHPANPGLLGEVPSTAERICAGKTQGRHHIPQQEINALLAAKAGEGKVVVRLRWEDPFIFGEEEEARYLHQAGIRFEVVPGLTAGFAAAAYAGIPLARRNFTNTLGLVTGYEDPADKMPGLDWEKLATGVETLVFYVETANLPLIATRLMAQGRPATTPVAVISQAATPRQKILVATLADIVEKARDSEISSPAVIVIGEVVNLREELRWFENRPLFGKRILVTRTADQAGSFAALLEERGAQAISCPVIEIVPPPSWADLDAEMSRLPETDILILTSVNAVHCFFSRLRESGKDMRALNGVAVVAVGPKTAAAIEALGLRPDFIPSEYRAEGVVQLLLEQGIAGKRVLYPRAELARDVIPKELSAAGAKVSAPVAYRTVPPADGGRRIRRLLTEGGVDAVTFTSSSTVENFLRMVGPDAPRLLEKVPVVSIGPLTTATAKRLGFSVTIEPPSFTLEGVVEAMTEYYVRSSRSDVRC
jgi:uroporphyrinogen III methyltransferase / synthase